MSKDALAGVYAEILENSEFRTVVEEHPEVLGDYDLTDTERAAILDEVTNDVGGFGFGMGPAMGALTGGPALSPGVASRLGSALNSAAGLPTGALTGPGFLSNAACCPWGHAVIGNFTGSPSM